MFMMMFGGNTPQQANHQQLTNQAQSCQTEVGYRPKNGGISNGF